MMTPRSRQSLRALRASVGQQRHGETVVWLFGICLGMLTDRAEAEDALQEVFLAIWRRGQSHDPALGSAMTWLVTLTRNRERRARSEAASR